MIRDDAPIDDDETIFLVFVRIKYETDNFYKAFYSHEKAQKCCDDMNVKTCCGLFIVREEVIG